jgi:riboflavin kinase/FMN adenylyltransferase
MRHDGWPAPTYFRSGSVTTVGVFDGFHLGHQTVLARAMEEGSRLAVPVVMVTFDPHPRAIVSHQGPPLQLRSLADRIDSAHKAGVDHVVVLHFDEAFAETSAEEFVRDGLVRSLNCQSLVVGSNFRCGRAGRGDVSFLRRQGLVHGFDVAAIDLVERGSGICSSTRLRAALARGDDAIAAEILGHAHV